MTKIWPASKYHNVISDKFRIGRTDWKEMKAGCAFDSLDNVRVKQVHLYEKPASGRL